MKVIASMVLVFVDAARVRRAMLGKHLEKHAHKFQEAGCETVTSGHCFDEVTWAKNTGIHENPDWYLGLTADSSFEEFQQVLHITGHGDCPAPCTDAACETVTSGHCFDEVTWAKNTGIHENPDWYPGLTADSSFEKFQQVLHITGHGDCPAPCTDTATVQATASTNVSASPTPGVLCSGGSVVPPAEDWLWSRDAVPSPSCTSPPVQNIAEMCAGDKTSVVIRGNGQPQCLSALMKDCKFNMHDIDQLDFKVNMLNCGGTWSAPLWMSPDHWAGGGASGEIDMLEQCPAHALHNNFAGGGTHATVKIADPNSFQGHTTMWKKADDNGVVSIFIKTCDPSEVVGGSCPQVGDVAYYPNIYGSNGCSNGQNCMYTLISDIWNGNNGDGGYQYCAGGRTHASSGCQFSIENIRFKTRAGTFAGKCALMNGGPAPPTPPTVPPPPTPPSPPSGGCTGAGQDPWQTGSEIKCCAGLVSTLKNWDGNRWYYKCMAR